MSDRSCSLITHHFSLSQPMAAQSITSTSIPRRQRSSSMQRREAIEGILYTSPWIIGFILFIAGPLIASLYLSFTKYNVLRPAKFIGMENYVVALTKDPLFLPSIGRTFYYAALLVPLSLIGSLV